MQIRPFTAADIQELERIYKEGGYDKEYPFSVFNDPHFTDLFAVENGDQTLISAGGIRLVPEIVIATDRASNIRQRHQALIMVIGVCEALSAGRKFPGMIVTTTDEHWYRVMLKRGFKIDVGHHLYYPVKQNG